MDITIHIPLWLIYSIAALGAFSLVSCLVQWILRLPVKTELVMDGNLESLEVGDAGYTYWFKNKRSELLRYSLCYNDNSDIFFKAGERVKIFSQKNILGKLIGKYVKRVKENQKCPA